MKLKAILLNVFLDSPREYWYNNYEDMMSVGFSSREEADSMAGESRVSVSKFVEVETIEDVK